MVEEKEEAAPIKMIVEKRDFRLLVDIALQYRNDLKYTPDKDSSERRLEWVNTAVERILLKSI